MLYYIPLTACDSQSDRRQFSLIQTVMWLGGWQRVLFLCSNNNLHCRDGGREISTSIALVLFRTAVWKKWAFGLTLQFASSLCSCDETFSVASLCSGAQPRHLQYHTSSLGSHPFHRSFLSIWSTLFFFNTRFDLNNTAMWKHFPWETAELCDYFCLTRYLTCICMPAEKLWMQVCVVLHE